MFYTTGDIAKLCGVSVRTVQYYDTRGLLIPSELSCGGRRLYSESDLDRMKIICFLRDLDLPIDSIKKLFEEEHPENVISMLLDRQENMLREEIAEKEKCADRISEVKRSLARLPSFTVESIKDIVYIMENKKQLRRLRIGMLVCGFVMEAIEVSTLMLGILEGIWLPYIIGMIFVVLIGIGISSVYFKCTSYICPHCHSVFKPRMKDSFFARHTPNTRKLKCIHCGYSGFCVETYGRKIKYAENK